MKAMLFDVRRCNGCMKCIEACCSLNQSTEEGERACFSRDDLSARRYTTLSKTEEGRFVRRLCLHCLEPSCASACLVGALKKTKDGPVVYDASKCIGCRYCMLACPFEVPKYEWDTLLPFIQKCQMCHDKEGGPACVAACPHFAAKYGDRDELIEVARKRIAKHPDQYISHIWGEHAAGGTSVMFISDVSLDQFWPAHLAEQSVPELVGPVVKATPFVFLGMASTVSALSWIIQRRNRMAESTSKGGDSCDSTQS